MIGVLALGQEFGHDRLHTAVALALSHGACDVAAVRYLLIEASLHKAEPEPRFAEINRRTSDHEFCRALELARDAGLWRLDNRWRNVIPHGAPVWLPRARQREACAR